MFEQDYIMRVIKEMIRAILKLLFSIDTDSPTMELLSEKEQVETTEKLMERLMAGKSMKRKMRYMSWRLTETGAIWRWRCCSILTSTTRRMASWRRMATAERRSGRD